MNAPHLNHLPLRQSAACGLMIVVAALLGLSLGFALRPSREIPTKQVLATEAASNQTDPASSTFNSRNDKGEIKDDSPLATELERDLSMAKGVTRWLHWMDAVEKAGPGDFPRLAALAQNDKTALRLLAAHWIDRDPRQMFEKLVEMSKAGSNNATEELARMLFDEWAKKDPEAVVSAMNEAGDFGRRDRWRTQVAMEVIEQDAEEGLKLFSDWDINNFIPRMTAVERWARANPPHAAEFVMAHQAGAVSDAALETIAKEWSKTDPAGALEMAIQNRGKLGSQLASVALYGWADRNLEEAAQWLAAAEPSSRNDLSPAFVQAWAEKDASTALEWSQLNLTGTTLTRAVSGVVKGAAEKNVNQAAQLVAGMKPSAARAEGALAVAEKWLPHWSAEDRIPQPEAIEWLGSLDNLSVVNVLESIQSWWWAADSKSLTDFMSARAENIPKQLFSTLASQMSRKDPIQALNWAESLPNKIAVGAGGEAFATWRRSQHESAMRWLGELPSSDSRKIPFLEHAVRDLAFDFRASEQIRGMSPGEREQMKRVLDRIALPEDRRATLVGALNGQ